MPTQLPPAARRPRTLGASLGRFNYIIVPVLAAVAALLVGAVILLLLGANPLEAYAAMAQGALGTPNAIAETLVKAGPLLFVALGTCIAYRGGVINIGGEGQLVMGALCATTITLALPGLPSWLLIPVALLGGLLGGGAWAGLAGVLKTRFRVNEVLSTIMLNAIAIQFMNFLLRGVMIDPTELDNAIRIPQTQRLPIAADLPRLIPTRLHLGIAVGVLVAVLVYLLLWRTTVGYRIRAVGQNLFASRYAGIHVNRYQILAIVLSGALAGLGGAVEVMGVNHRLFTDGSATGFTGNAGFNGIVVALFGGLHPLGALPASFFFGALIVGANSLQRTVQVPSAFVTTLNGLVVIFVVASQLWSKRSAAPKAAPEAAAAGATGRAGHLGTGIQAMISELFTVHVIVGIIASGIRLATSYLYAALGETFGQVSGVLNLGVEGIMLVGAFAAYYIAFTTGSLVGGLLIAIGAGALMGLFMAFISVTLRAEQGISGIGLYLFGLGLSDLLFRVTIGTPRPLPGFPNLQLPILSDLPILGPILFNQNVLVYGAFALVPVTWFILNKTTLGLKIRAVGQSPEAADSLGISVTKVRYFTVTLGGALAGLAGASLSIALLNVFQQNLTSGQGFIAVALVYFGAWKPGRVMLGALLFSMVIALQLWIQTLGIPLPSDIAGMLPYVLTIVALIFAARQIVTQPAALTKPYERGH